MSPPLYSTTVELGLGHSAIVEIAEIDPEPAPQRGATWPDASDWPRAQLTISLPGVTDGYAYAIRLVPELECAEFDARWGESWEGGPLRPTHRRWVTRASTEFLEDAVAQLQTLATTTLAPLIAHCRARSERLARRGATLARGRAPRTASERPIEIDSTPTASYAATDNDDSSQRFALLELDTKTEQQSTIKPARRRRVA